jgi:hypothetical protein
MTLLQGLVGEWPAINRLLEEALALPPGERAAWVERLDDTQAPMKDTLRRLLAVASAETADFMGTLPKLGDALPDAAHTDAGAAQADELVGPWRLLRELGTGGMGSVWLAERADGSLKRQVALKLPRLSWARGLAERMARERDILATLEHPHIARLYDAGVDALGRPWLALEHVQGRPIDAFCREQRVGLNARVDLLQQVCDAVAYAHSRLVIHRDLKPSNILVTNDGRVKLLDFGIARLVEADGNGGEATQAIFTPGYASPEQLQGLPLSTATDVYSLGVVAHELLCGRRPFAHRAQGAAALLQAIVAEDPPLPSAGRLTSEDSAERGTTPQAWRRQLSGDLDAVLLRSLARDGGARYGSVPALADDLRRWRAGQPVQARRPGTAELLLRFVRRHRWAVAGGSAALAALVATAVVALVMGLQAREQSQRAQASRDFLLGLFERADPDLRGGREATARELLLPAEQDAARLPAAQQHEVLQTIAELWMHFGDFTRSATVQARLTQALTAQGGVALARSRVHEARIAVLQDRLDDAVQLLAQAEQAAPPGRWPEALRALAAEQQGWVHTYRDEERLAEAQFRIAREAAQRAGAADVESRALYGLAQAQYGGGRWQDALATQRVLAERLQGTAAPASRERGVLLLALTTTLYDLGRYAEGWAAAQQLVQEGQALYGPGPQAQLRDRTPWLRYCLQLGQAPLAAAWLREHPASPESLAAYGALSVADWYAVSARVWAAVGERALAEEATAQARAQLRLLPQAEQPLWEQRTTLAAAMASLELGDAAGAWALLRAGTEAPQDTQPGLRPYFDRTAAVALARVGQLAAATELLQRARAATTARGDLPHPDAAVIELNRALLLLGSPAASPRAVLDAISAAAPVLAAAYGAAHPLAQRAAALQAALPPSDAEWSASDLERLRRAAGPSATQLFL